VSACKDLADVRFGSLQFAAITVLLASDDDATRPDLRNTLQSILNDLGTPSLRGDANAPSIVYSKRHDGLAQTLARCVRGIWNRNVVLYSPTMGFGLGVAEGSLLEAKSRLQGLQRFNSE
jgi:nuclear pore complex protein Nup155